MADEQSPTVEIAPTVIVSNSDGVENNAEEIQSSGDEPNSDNVGSQSDGDGASSVSDAVAIAAIQAERDVTLGEISSDIERERIRLEQERVEQISEKNEELEECRREIAELREQMEQLRLSIQPQQLEEAEMEELSETVPEPNLIQPSTAAPTPEMETELSEESVEENPVVVEETRTVRKFIAI